MEYANEVLQLGIKLTELFAKNTSSWVSTKVSQARERHDKKEMQQTYEEIINSLLDDNMEIQRIAMTYKELYEKVNISDEDIVHLQNTLKQTIELISKYDSNIDDNKESIGLIVDLLNVDTLKTMQLLGFNYKEAIGEPLTQLCSSFILSKVKVMPKRQKDKK